MSWRCYQRIQEENMITEIDVDTTPALGWGEAVKGSFKGNERVGVNKWLRMCPQRFPSVASYASSWAQVLRIVSISFLFYVKWSFFFFLRDVNVNMFCSLPRATVQYTTDDLCVFNGAVWERHEFCISRAGMLVFLCVLSWLGGLF